MSANPGPVGSRRRRLVGLITAGALAAAGITGLVARGAAADPVLPPLTAAELLTRVATAEVDGLSATFEQRSNLGLPALPSGMGDSGDELQTALTMLTGDHTVRVWLAKPDRARVALVDGDTESAVIRNGDELWTWSSEHQRAGHATLSPAEREHPSATPGSPTEAVSRLLAELEPSTDVTTSGTGYVAGRPVYQLVLTPKDDASLVGQVRVSVDAAEFVPLGFRVIADDGSDAVTLAASSVDFSRPDDSIFRFSPPAGVEVKELTFGDDQPKDHPQPKTDERPKLHGAGWTTVAVAELGDHEPDQATRALLQSLPAVSGDWGSGRLLSTALVNAVITDDGRVAVGSVIPERLYAALAAK